MCNISTGRGHQRWAFYEETTALAKAQKKSTGKLRKLKARECG